MIIVGERINSSREPVARAIQRRDAGFIQREAVMQVTAGADYVDVNAGVFGGGEAKWLEWLVRVVQDAVDKPLCLDSTNPQALAAALAATRSKPLVNSITAQREQFQAVLPLLKRQPCSVVALCLDDSGIPAAAEGIPPDDIFIDPLVQPISVDPNAGVVALEAIAQIKRRYPGIRTIYGVSNISFGLPFRKLLNQVFMGLAFARGLDAAIVDPCQRPTMSSIVAAEALLGRDQYGMKYIKAYREKKL